MFSPTVIINWNKLPDEMVKAESVWTFENKLDRLWKNQRLKYDYKENSDMNFGNQHIRHTDQGIESLELESQA